MTPSIFASVSVPLTSILFFLDGYGASSVAPRESAVMDLSAKSLNPNKRLKEDFVSNLTGSSMLEIAALLLIVPALVLLRKFSSFSSERGLASTNNFVRKMNDRETSKCKDLRSSTLELAKDFAIVILPVILVFTVLAEWLYFLAIILIVVLLFCISAKRPSFSTLNTEMEPQHLSSSKMSILSYRVFMVVITCICILAVDFKIFPRRYAKTETYGTGLMDLGVGSFVVANSLVSRQSRGIMFVNLKVAIQSVSPLVLLGAGRLIFTAGVEYQVHVGEYGVHWNFFFTLAAISLLTSIFHIHPKYCGIFGLFILIAYQMSLKYGLSNFLLSSERASDIISQNKEGIFSIFGYWGMYLIGVHLGFSIFFVNGASIKAANKQHTRSSVWILCIIFWSLTVILNRYVERVSRRMVLSVLMLSDFVPVQRPLLLEEVFNQNLLGSFLLDLSISSSEIVERHNSPDWDCSLHLPLWVSNTERAAVEDHIEEWTMQLEACGADIDLIASIIQKPLRPLWISQKTVIWLNEVPKYDSWDFTPIILVSSSASHGTIQQRSTSEFSWHYIPGAGDDEESWARGLHPTLFWKHAYDLIDSGPSMCNQNVSELVEKDRVYRAQRGDFSPQVTIRTWKKLTDNAEQSCMTMTSELSESMTAKSSNSERGLYWIGSTNVAVGTTVDGDNTNTCADCILNCDPKSILGCSTSDDGYLHLPILSSKLDRFSLMNSLHLAIRFAGWHLKRGKKLVICCHNGEDISICVCLAILAALFDEEGCFDDGKLYMSTIITKWEMRRRLVFICKFAVNARPSRGNLKQVYGFLRREREHLVPTDPVSDVDVLEQKS